MRWIGRAENNGWGMQGKFNSFQKTMLQWNELHPYNAVHVARIPMALDAERLQHSLRVGLEQNGLSRLTLDRRDCSYSYQPGPPPGEIPILSDEKDTGRALEAELERQINTPFDLTPGFTPFRFFALADNDSFLLGVAYFHAVADGESIVVLLRHLVRCYRNQGEPALSEFTAYPGDRAYLLRHHAGVAVRKLLAFPGQMRRMRHSSRPRYRDAADFENGFQWFTLSAEQWQAVVVAGKDWNVTVNDLLLALLLKSIAPLAAGRLTARKRRDISIGCIVNLRKQLNIDSTRVFGLFLGSFIVTQAVSDGVSLRKLAGDIRDETMAIKRRRLFLATPIELGLGRVVVRMFSPERRKKFYQKNYPLWGGLTNMNLNSLWDQSDEAYPLDYLRGVSTGPATPLAFSVTTVGDHTNVGVSYRATVYSPGEIRSVQDCFRREIEQLHVSV